jgi:hypothetical protein
MVVSDAEDREQDEINQEPPGSRTTAYGHVTGFQDGL